ncbi:MAG: hypothetical protein ACX93T_01935 [Bacteroidota bacterium]
MEALNRGHQTLIASEKDIKIAYTLPQARQDAKTFGTTDLTAAQQQWLDRKFQTSTSYKKRFNKILIYINHSAPFVRSAAYQALRELLIDHTELASTTALQYVKKVLRTMGIREHTKETLCLLNTLINVNPELALPSVPILIHLTKSSREPATDDVANMRKRMLKTLTSTIVTASSDCVPYLIKYMHKRTRFTKGSDVASVSSITIPELNVAEQLLQTDIVCKNTQYFDQVLETVLDGASLHDLVWGKPPFKNPTIHAYAQDLLKNTIQQCPNATNSKYHVLSAQASKEIPDMAALVYMTAFATADHKRTASLLLLLNAIERATDTRVQILANSLHNEARMNRNTAQGLTGWVSDVLVDTTTQSVKRKLVRKQDAGGVVVPLLRLLREITTYDPSSLPEAFTIIQRMLCKEKGLDIVRVEALDTLTHIVNRDASYSLKAIQMLTLYTNNASSHVREATFRLLHAILKADVQHAIDATVLDSLKKFKQDTHKQIRQKAEELLSEFISTTP